MSDPASAHATTVAAMDDASGAGEIDDLRRRLRRVELALAATGDAVWEWNLVTNETYYSPRWYEQLGYRDGELPMGFETWKGLCHPDDFEAAVATINATLMLPTSEGYATEFRMKHADGSWIWILGRGRVVERDAAGAPVLVSGTNADISARRRTEHDLAESDRRLRALADNLPRGMMYQLVIDAEGRRRFAFVSAGVTQAHGLTPEQVYRDAGLIYAQIHPDDLAGLVAAEEESRRTGAVFEVEGRMRHPDGDERWVLVRSSPRRGGHGETIWDGVELDITESRRAQLAAVEHERRFRLMVQNFNDILLIMDREGIERYVSSACERILGFAPEELIGRPGIAFVHADDHAAIREAMYATVSGAMRSVTLEFRHVHKDGSWRWLEAVGTSMLNDPAIAGVVMIARDVTARHHAEAERERLEDHLRHAQKMESIGRLAGGIAHDFNNLLTAIKGNVALALADLADPAAARELLEEAELAADSAANLTQQLLAFSRKQVVAPRVIDLHTTIAGLQKMLGRLLGEPIALDVGLAPGLWAVKIDPGQLEQILVNLALNARDAMPAGGRLTIAAANATLSETRARARDLAPGDYVQIEVADTGPGMSEAIRARAFEPFFTTKELGKGTGLGLATVYGAVTQHRGHIELRTSSAGTAFTLLLPRCTEPTAAAPEAARAGLPTGTETIVLVEDDHQVRALALRILRRLGYTVHAFASAEAALAELDRLEPLDLLLTDVVMPGMNGRELADAVRARRAAIKVLFSSGYSPDDIVRHGVHDGRLDLLEKPYQPSTLATRVRAILDRA
ncbi:MAG: PAS domain-containing protein [Deltaproteobacteria bacterium]|nr:PAS domain-containing protein [Deltaproteobacteria bacterium]